MVSKNPQRIHLRGGVEENRKPKKLFTSHYNIIKIMKWKK
jgi:hypothetical protein